MSESSEKSEIVRAAPARGSRSLVLAFRVVLLLFAAAAVGVAVFVAASRDRSASHSGARYVCPMHPEVTSATAGECPICRMALEPVNPGGASAAIAWSAYQAYDILRRRGYGPDAPAPAWVEDNGVITAIIYDDELGAIVPGVRALFTTAVPPARTIQVYATSERPQPWDRSTSRVSFRLASDPALATRDSSVETPAEAPSAATRDADAPPPNPGEMGWLRVTAKARELGVIPFAAVLEAGEGPYVLVASRDGKALSRRSVEIGRVFGGLAFVLSGLGPQERVLVRSAFFVDAERRLRREATVEVTP